MNLNRILIEISRFPKDHSRRFRTLCAKSQRGKRRCRSRDNDVVVRNGKTRPLYYAVTAVDRYGNESTALQLTVSRSHYAATKIIKNEGNRLRLPSKGKVLDAPYIILETLEGKSVATIPYRGSHADISNIADGMYVLRSLNRKGITHRLGYVLIKR